MVPASDSFLGFSTLALAVATFVLAGVAIWQLKEAKAERATAARSLAIAEATFRVEQRPELIALGEVEGRKRPVHTGASPSVWKDPGTVMAGTEFLGSTVGVLSFEVLNIGRGAAEILRVRLMSLDTLFEGGDSVYWEPEIPVRRPIPVAAGGSAPVDLVLGPEPPRWFSGHMQSGLKFWAEITYSDLGGVEEHVRWFEFWRRPETEPEWFVNQVLRSVPSQFRNLPPGVPVVEPEVT